MKKCPCSRRELLRKLQIYDFNIQEAALYLNSHPCDHRAMEYYQHFRCLRDKAAHMYECCFGPLTNRDNRSCEWQYIYEPWPWEREA